MEEQGELASALIIGEIREWFQEVTAWLDISTVNPAVLFAHLKDGAENWNEKLREFCQREDIRTGTTMSLLLIIREHYYIIHVGDSRIYRYHDGLEQLTMDARHVDRTLSTWLLKKNPDIKVGYR